MLKTCLFCLVLGGLFLSCGETSDEASPTSPLQALAQNMRFIEGGAYSFPARTEFGKEVSFSGEIADFSIGTYELTQTEWQAVMDTLPPNLNNPESGKHPVEGVSWDEVQQFIQALNEQTGKHYRLPTALEWEYAARGGQKSQHYLYSGSNDPAHDAVWHGGNIPPEKHTNKHFTMPVGTKKPNELGLYDMSGNVQEWIAGCVGSRYQGATYFVEGEKFAIADSCDMKMVRGGGATDWIYNCTIEHREDHPRIHRSAVLGFRLAHDAE